MAHTLDSDEYGIIEAMQADGSFVDGDHIVYKQYENHGEKYLDKDAHLKQEWVAHTVAHRLAKWIPGGSIIIAPETSSINLGEMVRVFANGIVVPTRKVKDIHTFDESVLPLLRSGKRIIGIDDISNNGRTLREIQAALNNYGLTLDEFCVMVDRNPEQSAGITDLQFIALASIQMEQWHESEVPEWLKKRAISTKLGNGRRWVGENLNTFEMNKQRFHKEELGFHFDDGKRLRQMEIDGWFLEDR